MEEGVGPADVVNNTAPFFNRDRIQTARQAAEQSWSNLRNRPEDGVGNTLVNNNSGTLVQNYQASTNQTVDNWQSNIVSTSTKRKLNISYKIQHRGLEQTRLWTIKQ